MDSCTRETEQPHKRTAVFTRIFREIVPRGTVKTNAQLVRHNREVKSMKKRSTSSRSSGSSTSKRSTSKRGTGGKRRNAKRGGKRS